MDLEITYESDLELAIKIIGDAIMMHPLVMKAREAKGIEEPVTVMVRELARDGIQIRGIVTTMTIEENFGACSDIRRELVRLFEQEPRVDFAYPHVQVVAAGSADSNGQVSQFSQAGQFSQADQGGQDRR